MRLPTRGFRRSMPTSAALDVVAQKLNLKFFEVSAFSPIILVQASTRILVDLIMKHVQTASSFSTVHCIVTGRSTRRYYCDEHVTYEDYVWIWLTGPDRMEVFW